MTSTHRPGRPLGLWSLVSIGIGGMVGGSLFAVLGLAAVLAKGATPLSFIAAGIIALLTSYSYVKLSQAIPSIGGTVTFLNEAFGYGTLTGGLNILLCLSYVVGMSVNAHAVANYGLRFFPEGSPAFWNHVLMSSAVVLLTAVNVVGPQLVVKSELWINILKIAILLIFAVAGFSSIRYENLAPSTWAPGIEIVSGGMVLILCYQGFELIANASKDATTPKKTLPRAYYGSILFAILLYVAIAMVTLGNLPLSQIEKNSRTALAEAALPFLGPAGFTLVAIAGIIAASSAINASLYGSARISFIIAKRGQLPQELTQSVWHRPVEGLLIISVITLLVANFLTLTSISTLASAGFLLVYAAVNAANLKLRKQTKSVAWIPAAALGACLAALATMLVHLYQNSPKHIFQMAFMFGAVFLLELIYQKKAGRIRRASEAALEKQTDSPAPH